MPPVFPAGVAIQDYIASELAAQKAALEQAIERAKTVIHNSAIEEVAALITAAENTIKNKLTLASQEINDKIDESVQQHVNTIVKGNIDTAINETLIKIFQNGYIQWPGMPSPLEDVSLHFEGYSWHEVDYDGNFFRAKGRNAKPFSSKKLTKEQIKNGSYVFQDDEQGDSIRNIKGELGETESSSYAAWFNDAIEGGALFSDRQFKSWPSGQGYSTIYYKNIKFDASKSDGVSVAEENRPRNLTFTIWALVKDE